jgi:hypothetical protein
MTRNHDQRSLIEHWDGTAWRQVRSPGIAGSELTGVAAVSARNAWAVGISRGRALILHWNGTTWSRMPIPSLIGQLSDVTATSARNAWAVGNVFPRGSVNAHPLILHWDGTRWNRTPSPNPPSEPRGNWLFAVAAAGPRSAWAVGGTSITSADTTTLILHWNGTVWRRQRSPNQPGGPNLFGVAATSGRNAWAVGYATASSSSTVIVRWNGRSWDLVR